VERDALKHGKLFGYGTEAFCTETGSPTTESDEPFPEPVPAT
jgi:hypothetical protein